MSLNVFKIISMISKVLLLIYELKVQFKQLLQNLGVQKYFKSHQDKFFSELEISA
jgi:hypothetical protein